jgi:hypothetical protein
MTDDEFGAFLAEAKEELQRKQNELASAWGLRSYRRWSTDQQTGLIQFFDAADKLALQANAVQIGSYSPLSNTWLWSWANVTALPAERAKSERLKELAQITGFELFEDSHTFEVDEAMAWELAAVSVKHLHAKGCYRTPSSDGSNFCFLALMDLQRFQ